MHFHINDPMHCIGQEAMGEYLTVTGDGDGVEITADEEGKRVVYGKCWSEHFWYPPACRVARLALSSRFFWHLDVRVDLTFLEIELPTSV